MKNDKGPPDPEMSKSFDALLADLDDGAVVLKLTDELKDLVRHTLSVARSRGNAGQAVGALNLKLAFKVDATGEVEIRATYSTTQPKIPSALTRRWVDKGGNIVDSNPRQPSLPLHEAPSQNPNIRGL